MRRRRKTEKWGNIAVDSELQSIEPVEAQCTEDRLEYASTLGLGVVISPGLSLASG